MFAIPCRLAALALALATQARPVEGAQDPKVQVFVLAGQSNMEGHGRLRSLARLGERPEGAALWAAVRDPAGEWAVRKDVSIVWAAKQPDHGPLGVGWGVNADEIGPELAFGIVAGEQLDAPVLLIKTAWGGKDVYCDFRSPGAGAPDGAIQERLDLELARGQGREVGLYYRRLLAEVRDALARIDQLVPGYQGQGYELAGLAWFQGWNDYCVWHETPEVIEEYPHNLAALIRDLRAALDAPDLPVAIGEMGVGGPAIEARAANENDREARAMAAFRRAQRAVAEDPSLGGVVFVPTLGFWDARLEELRVMSESWSREKREQGIADTPDNELPSPALSAEFRGLGGHWYCHYNGSAVTYSLVGQALARALLPAPQAEPGR